MASDDWALRKIDELKASSDNAIAIGPFGSRMKAELYMSTGVPVIRGNNISDIRAPVGDFVFVSKETADQLKSSNVFAGDLVFPHRGAIGEVGIVPRDGTPRYLLSTSLMKLTCNEEVVDPVFLFYFFRSPTGRHELLKNTSTVGTPGIATPLTSLKSIEVTLPLFEEQRAIAHILGTLDDKIELNRRMNETLEAMSRAIFQSWFVDFDPVRSKAEGRNLGLPEIADLFPDRFEDSELGEIPKGWTIRTLYDCADYINGATFRNEHFSPDRTGLPVIKIGELKDGITAQTKFTEHSFDERYRISDGEILFSWSGSPDTSIDTFIWADGEGWLNQHIFKIQLKRSSEKSFIYNTLRFLKPVFIEIARNKQTTGLGHVTATDLKRLKIVKPPEVVLLTFNQLAGPQFEKTFANLQESHTLAAIRDALLPKLISGELRVKDAARFMAEAGA
jgi:type I restriction enzyme S subunit